MNQRGDFSRQNFLGKNSEEILANARVSVVGLGGGGSHVAQQLAHIGIGYICLIDPQEIDASNLNRLVGATTADVEAKTPKVKIAERVIKSIRPWITVKTTQSDWQASSDLLKSCHVLIGCIDGYIQRQNLERAARRFCLAYIDIGMDVSRLADGTHAVAGQMIRTTPGGPCMTCLGFLTQERLDREENNYGDAGINPQVVWTNGTLASLAIGALVQTLTPWFEYQKKYEWLELDGNLQTITESRQPRYYLKGECKHFPPNDVGDPFFDIRALPFEPHD